MKNNFLITLLSICILSCNENTSELKESAETETSQKNIALPDSFPTEWIEITLKDNQWVIYHPCDGAVFTLAFAERNNANFLDMISGNSVDEHKINSITQPMFPRQGVMVRTIAGEEQTYFMFEKKEDKTLFTISELPFDDGHPDAADVKKYLVPKNESSNYPLLHQPCKECWGNEICDTVKHK